VAESFFLLYALATRRLLAELFRAAASVVLAIAMLMFAAFLEAITIEYGLPGFGYAWVVAVVVALVLFTVWRRVRTLAGVPTGAEPTPPPSVPISGPPAAGTAQDPSYA
jgi:uncharacterized RDD family membrane protein YckC